MQSSSNMDHLSRLASKPGVQATLILSRLDGAVIRSTGLSPTTPAGSSFALDRSSASGFDAPRNGLVEHTEEKAEYGGESDGGKKSTEAMAKMIFEFVSAAGDLVGDFDEGDEVQLLRLRTRKYEMVIMPDPKYLLVVLHDPQKTS